MTKKEYIDALSSELAGFDEESKQDILLEIEDHIDALMKNHGEISESAIVADLEKPQSLAENLRREAGISETPTSEPEQPKGKARITIDGEDLEDVIKRALDIAGLFKKSRVFREAGSFKDKMGNTSDKRVRLDNIPVDGVKKLLVKSRSADLRVLLSLSNISIAAEGAEDSAFAIDNDEEGILQIKTGVRHEEPSLIEIRIPSTIESLELKTVSGDIEVLDRVGNLEMHSASGNITVRTCSGDVFAHSASGDVSLSQCCEDVKVQTASGSIKVELDSLCNAVTIDSASGDIELSYPDDFSGTIRWASVSGKGPAISSIGDGMVPISLRTVSGDIHVEKA
jgi:hypothetical protein